MTDKETKLARLVRARQELEKDCRLAELDGDEAGLRELEGEYMTLQHLIEEEVGMLDWSLS